MYILLCVWSAVDSRGEASEAGQGIFVKEVCKKEEKKGRRVREGGGKTGQDSRARDRERLGPRILALCDNEGEISSGNVQLWLLLMSFCRSCASST